jgi:hypothetical protein
MKIPIHLFEEESLRIPRYFLETTRIQKMESEQNDECAEADEIGEQLEMRQGRLEQIWEWSTDEAEFARDEDESAAESAAYEYA